MWPNWGKSGHFNLEMSKDQLVGRILSGEARIPGNALRTGNLSGDDWNRLAEAAGYLSQAQIYIDDATGISPGEMKARLRRMKDLDLVIIDYLQLMTTGRRIDNRVQEVSEMTRALKVMAKELQVPVITLSQLSREWKAERTTIGQCFPICANPVRLSRMRTRYGFCTGTHITIRNQKSKILQNVLSPKTDTVRPIR